jgi:hypothetical protein
MVTKVITVDKSDDPPVPKSGGRRLHVCVAKDYLAQMVAAFGAKEVLVGWDGTDAEALAALESDPRQFFAIGCDDVDASGRCKGHPL